jgi:hypothetical protein
MEYRHTQIATIIIALLLIFIAFYLFLLFKIPTFHPIQLIVIVIFVTLLVLFYSLTVEIKNNTLFCQFGIGLIRRKIPLSMIQEVKEVRNPWYSGWGIHWLPGQYWLWNVSGFRAVELVFKDGKRFRIGTDEPELLSRAIENNKTGS